MTSIFNDLHSRVHRLNKLPGWIKREDELSFGISGPKLRKLLPLIASLKKEKGAVLFGSAYSNFILGAVQLLTENEIDYRLVLKMPHTSKIVGNLSYLLRMVPPQNILQNSENLPPNFRIIPEGGEVPECLEGAKTLARSICQNEHEVGCHFSKVIIDAGTGLSAIGLILGLTDLNRNLPVHIFSMKISEEEFFNKLSPYKVTLPVHFHELSYHKSFGAVNNTLLSFINSFAQKEGIFLDPIYSAKLFYELTHTTLNILDNNSLVIHSGGALSLSGF